MTAPRVSVVVVSSGRPDALRRCLLGLSQQADAGCEVVVVADRPGLDAANSLPFAGRLKAFRQASANISRARNLGIAQSAGDVVAFVDDDAVPEPTWIRALSNGFSDPGLAAVTGPVLGRNGISLQWGSMAVNRLAQDVPTDPDMPIGDGLVRKLQGTNMAFRRKILEEIGGFDEAFSFYLDDTDMALRIGQAGLNTAWVPGAVVHHGYHSSSRRTEARVPLTLFDIGASSAVFLRKHAEAADRPPALRRLEAEQSSRLLRMAKARKIDAHGTRALMETLRDGIAAGETRDSAVPDIAHAPGRFEPLMDEDPPPPVILSGRVHRLARLRREAADLVARGQPVTLFCFEPTPRKHSMRFTDGGWWEQRGGLFGPSDRNGPRLQFWSFRGRQAAERRRISATRGLSDPKET